MASEAKEGVRVSQARRLAYGLGILLLLSLMCAPLFRDMIDRNAPRAVAGVIDFGGWNGWNRPVELGGEWRLQLMPEGGAPLAGSARVPGVWEGQRFGGVEAPGRGTGLYSLRIEGLPPGPYRIHMPSLYAGVEMFVDGRRVSMRGRAGADAASTDVEVRAHDIIIPGGAPRLLQVRVASYLHRDNGIEGVPVIGREEAMLKWSGLEWAQEFLFHISLILLTMYGLVVFLFRREDRASLYFALSCLFFQPGSAVIGYDNMLLLAWPELGFRGMLAILYLPGLICVAFFLAYARELFPRETPQRWFWAIEAGFGGFIALQAVLLTLGETYWSSRAYSWSMLLTIVSLSTMVYIVARAAWRGRDGAVIFLIGITFFALMILALALVGNGIVARDRIAGIDLVTYGMLMLLFSHIVILAERWSVAMDETRATNADLRSLLDMSSSVASEMQLAQLLGKIVEVASRIVHAERSSLFLHDVHKQELWSLVAQGNDVGEIRFPDDRGIAGAAFQAGGTINVPDAYADERFNRAVDRETGFRTRSILAMPVFARDGRKLGVMQALNREGGGGFSEVDADRMAAFVAQASVSIDNATLFSEVVSSRNYNESILASMSSGVITLDQDSRIAKINDAAAAIIEVPPEALSGVRAHDVLAETNAWLIEEIDAVTESGASKVLLDVEIRTGAGRAKSVNLSIVPLIDEGAAAGVLVLIEDISEGKRLQGAMRRFMPQKVVDQVLDREDDLLFGSACRASVLFADIRNFTSMSEKLGARETVDMLNEVFTELFEAVSGTDGILDKYIGDAVMAVYGVPFAGDRDARNSVDAAVQMVRMIGTINEGRRGRGLDDLRLGIGIATGDVVAGTIGSPKRMDYTVIGDSVNLASRLQDTTKAFRTAIVVDATTAAQVEGVHPVRELDRIRVRGRQQLERIYEVIIDGADAAARTIAYDQARAKLARRDWEGAAKAFDAILAAWPEDGPSLLMRDRARGAMKSPPPADWDGVW